MRSWTRVNQSDAPAAGVWDVPARFQGQHIEVAFWRPAVQASEADEDAPFKREHDISSGEVSYWRNTTKPKPGVYYAPHIEALQKVGEALQAVPCERSSITSCLAKEEKRTKHLKQSGFANYDEWGMCPSCGAHWHTTRAETLLQLAAKHRAEDEARR